ncbi:MAG: hypothetical protein ACJAZ2_002290 [Glaciecola sp.]|jgi:hypothetical protein
MNGVKLLLFSLLFVSCFQSCHVQHDNTIGDANDTVKACDRYELPKSKYNVILIIGQSNTHKGTGLNLNIDTCAKGVMQLGRIGDRDHRIVPAAEPLDHHSPQKQKIGFGLTFANLFKNELLLTSDTLVVIPCGKGSTGFCDNQWNKNDPLYKDAVHRVSYVMANHPGSVLQAILWHQGEKGSDRDNYEALLMSFISDIRKELNSPNVPFILGGMVPFWVSENVKRREQQNKIETVSNSICNGGYADPEVPFAIVKEKNDIDHIHFDAAGQREMGKRYFKEYLKVISE